MSSIHLVCRGGNGFGSGHLYRTSWLAEALRESRAPAPLVRVHCLATPEGLAFWGKNETVAWIDAPSLDLIESGPEDVVCVDWLDSDAGQAARLAQRSHAVALLDDYGPAQKSACLVVNALLSPLEDAEVSVDGRRIVSGSSWVQLPPESVRLRNDALPAQQALAQHLLSPLEFVGQPVRLVLVNFGGLAAPLPVATALKALAAAGYDGKVVVMPAPAERVDYCLEVDWHPAGPEFHAFLAAADLTICAGGLALYEAAFLGIPALCLPLVGHQAETAAKLAQAGCCENAGLSADGNPERLACVVSRLLHAPQVRGSMSAAGLRLLDGRGLARTAEAVIDLLGARR